MLATDIVTPWQWRWGVVDRLRQEPSGWWAVALSAGSFGLSVLLVIVVLSGSFTKNTVNLADFKDQTQAQLSTMSAQIARLADAVNNGPRSADLAAITTQISNIDARVRVLETENASERATIAAQQAVLDGIQAASKAALGHR